MRIQDLKLNDQVLSFNPEINEYFLDKVILIDK